MKSIEEIKLDLIQNISTERDNVLNNFEEVLNKVEVEKDYLELYHILNKESIANINKNLMKDILENLLKSDFFKKSNTVISNSKITFYNDEFKVSFSCSRDYEIEVDYINIDKSAIEPREPIKLISEKDINYMNLISKYIESKSIDNYNNLIKFERKHNNNKILVMPISSKHNILLNSKLVELNLYKIQDELNKMAYEERLKEYEERKQLAKEFLESLRELETFASKGWRLTSYL